MQRSENEDVKKIKDEKHQTDFTVQCSSTRILPVTHATPHGLSDIFTLPFSFYKVDLRLFMVLSEMRTSRQQHDV